MLKKAICVIFIPILIFVYSLEAAALKESDLSAASAVVYCKETGEVIFEKNSSSLLSMASTTKIMTSVIALERNTPDKVVEITAEMANVEGSSSGLHEGDRLTLEDLVYCMLLESGNDAANSVAISIGGSIENFAVIMNKKAQELGMSNTSFATPSGLDDEKHYTTAYDMALLTAYALDNVDFVKICSADSYSVNFVGEEKRVTLYNHNRLLKEYEDCIGVKTGFTKKSGRCLVSAAKRNGITLIAVTLNAGDDWNDHKKMLDFGFECFGKKAADCDFTAYSVPVTGSHKVNVGVECPDFSLSYLKEKGQNFTRKIYLEKFLYAPVEKGDVIGYAEYYNGDVLLAKVPLTAADSADIIQKEEKINFIDRLFSLFDRW